ncbi:MAG: SusD/RagB family nutrient-binding outer membrane lipoprotein [Bacteroidia bacterium]|nr:SusD/RagB family nutrient-binding outer membrane lipoprotein [Bacteroidia bacterium]
MKKLLILLFIGAVSAFSSCGFLDGNKPGDKTPFNPEVYFEEAMITNTDVQVGHLQRISALWSGQLVGYNGSYRLLYDYNMTSEETNDIWEKAFPGVITPMREVQIQMEDDLLHRGIAKVMEAYIMGTLTSLFGDVPYSEVLQANVSSPKFDEQLIVYDAVQDLLDEAIADLEVAQTQVLSYDVYFKGDAEKWVSTAWTLKARFFMQVKDYSNAFASAGNGISAPENSLKYYPALISGNAQQNRFYEALSGQYAGQIGTTNAFLMDLLAAGTPVSRNHAKTNEASRRAYFSIDAVFPSNNRGIAASDEPQGLVTYEENLLILAEAAARIQGLAQGLVYLNELRSYLNSGLAFKKLNTSDLLVYEAFEEADFSNGGIENPYGQESVRAFLREVIEERYVSGFGSYMAFDDARRLRKDDQDIDVPFPLNTPSATLFPERFVIPYIEQINNVNAPEDPGIFEKTDVNK